MRLPITVLVPIACAICTGCTPLTADSADTGLIDLVAGLTDSSSDTLAAAATSAASATPSVVTGSVGATGEYQLFELGYGLTGEDWTIADGSTQAGAHSFLIALFDSNYELLRREVLTSSRPLEHILRADTGTLYLGVTPTFSGSGGDFRFKVSRRSDQPVPAPSPQAVWLNFGGGTSVAVHGRDGISFPAFDGTLLGSAYDGATDALKAGIVEAMREDYAAYNVEILTSDDGPPPAGPYAAIHFGGSDSRLLGLADSVDQYNSDPWQVAVVYVNGFSDYWTMKLTANEMGQMVGNVASHELGHLLGLFHTKVPKDLMDTTGTAWDLAANQAFTTADLEPSVFPFGRENSSQRLAEILGHNPDAPDSALAKDGQSQTMSRKVVLRAMTRDLLRGRCGTCLDLDN